MELFAVVTDAPKAAPAGSDTPSSTIQLAKLGRFNHPRYGKFSVTPDTFDKFVANFHYRGGRVPIDFDHAPDKGGSSEAAGWITGLKVKDGKLFGDVEWTPKGREAVADKRYLLVSPTWSLDYTDDEGKHLGPTLLAAALTNRPYFSRMATVSLSAFADNGDPLTFEEPSEATHDLTEAEELALEREIQRELANFAISGGTTVKTVGGGGGGGGGKSATTVRTVGGGGGGGGLGGKSATTVKTVGGGSAKGGLGGRSATTVKTFSLGDTGPFVRVLQAHAGAKVDGKFGPKTHQAVRRFQVTKGLKADGKCGPKTQAKMPGMPGYGLSGTVVHTKPGA